MWCENFAIWPWWWPWEFQTGWDFKPFWKKQIKTNLLLKPRLISEHRKLILILFINILYFTLLRPFNRFRSKHSLSPNQLVNSHAVGVEYCLRCRDGHEATILALLYYFVGWTTSFDLAAENLSHVWVRLFLKKLKIVTKKDQRKPTDLTSNCDFF